ncbi:MAG TPA: primosomal protein N', partial [Dissulfurispiraceae bacterium]|nr:primosomal protein N' [Dissulfurispiraceae bacterium]
YRSFLFKASSHGDEHRLIAGILETVTASVMGVIVLVPEITRIEPLSAALGEIAGERLAIIHSRLTRARRLDAIRRIISGESDIIIGTRSAVLVPAPAVGFIAVVCEHSPSYKAEEGMRYHGRDVAVMRALIESAPVLLSSISPSLESTYNTISKKYSVLKAPPGVAIFGHRSGDPLSASLANAPEPIASGESPVASIRQRPTVMIVRRPRRHAPTLSREVLNRSKRILSSEDAVLFLPPRKGYSLLCCNECGQVALCPSCRLPLVFHKTPGLTRCQRCRNQGQAPDRCSVCGGFQIVPFKSGTEKVKEFLEETLGVEARLIEKSKGATLGSFEIAVTDLVPVLVGTAHATRRLSEGSLGAVVFVDIDTLLSRPHFRSSERTFQEVLQASRLVRPGGTVLLQTAVPTLPIFRNLRNLDYEGFTREELIQRKSLGFPPYSRMILITVSSKGMSGGELKKLFVAQSHPAVERLGPFEKDPPLQHYQRTLQVVFRSTRREELHAAARDFVAVFGALKGVRVSIDVDPLEV